MFAADRSRTDRSDHWAACSLFFFLSGFSGLMYEVIWFKRFSHVWGCSTLAMASVVASFLLGLGLGGYLGGHLAVRSRRLLFWYGLFEGAIGVMAFLVPYELLWLQQSAGTMYASIQNHSVLYYVARCTVTFTAIGPACVLMGATLPLLVEHLSRSGPRTREVTGWLYATNTLGAALGCYLAGFHLLPSLGLYWSSLMAVGLNVSVGAGALLLARRRSDTPCEAPGTERIDTCQGHPRLWRLYLGACATGLASLMLQMVWVRQLSLILGGTTYAFTAVLVVFLLGIGVGGLCLHMWMPRMPAVHYVLPCVSLGILVLTGLGQLAIPYLTYGIGLLKPLRSGLTFNALACVGASSMLQFMPAVGMGLLFPVFVHAIRLRSEHLGRAVGTTYALNTIGCLVGASLTSVLLFQVLGTTRTTALAMLLYLLVFGMHFPSRGHRSACVRLVCTALGAAVILLTTKPLDPRITNMGMYLYGYHSPEHGRRFKILDFVEGPSCNVLTIESPNASNRAIHINGKATTGLRDMPTQLALAYFPRFLRPNARKVLNIGFGSGTTAGASLLFANTEVVCCEIEPAVFHASQHFHAHNHKPEQSSHFTVVLDDGRNYLQRTTEKFDIIISQPSNPWIAGVSNLFTTQFYREARSKLAADGVLAQWIRLYSSSPSEYAMIVRTVQNVFSYSLLMHLSDRDTLMIASASPLTIDERAAERSQLLVDDEEAVSLDLVRYFDTTSVARLLFRHILLDADGLHRLAASHGPRVFNTDLNMRLEYSAPLYMFDDRTSPSRTNKALLLASDVSLFRDTFDRLGLSQDHADEIYALAAVCLDKGMGEKARELVEFGLSVDPADADLAALEQLTTFSLNQRSARARPPSATAQSVIHFSRFGVAMWKQRRYKEAASIFERLVVDFPHSATLWTNLGLNCQNLGERYEAEQAYRKALSLDPVDAFTLGSYEAFNRQSDRHDGYLPRSASLTEDAQECNSAGSGNTARQNTGERIAREVKAKEP